MNTKFCILNSHHHSSRRRSIVLWNLKRLNLDIGGNVSYWPFKMKASFLSWEREGGTQVSCEESCGPTWALLGLWEDGLGSLICLCVMLLFFCAFVDITKLMGWKFGMLWGFFWALALSPLLRQVCLVFSSWILVHHNLTARIIHISPNRSDQSNIYHVF